MGSGGGFQVSLIYAELCRGLDGANRRCQLSDDIVAGHRRRGEENTVRGCLIPYPVYFAMKPHALEFHTREDGSLCFIGRSTDIFL